MAMGDCFKSTPIAWEWRNTGIPLYQLITIRKSVRPLLSLFVTFSFLNYLLTYLTSFKKATWACQLRMVIEVQQRINSACNWEKTLYFLRDVKKWLFSYKIESNTTHFVWGSHYLIKITYSTALILLKLITLKRYMMYSVWPAKVPTYIVKIQEKTGNETGHNHVPSIYKVTLLPIWYTNKMVRYVESCHVILWAPLSMACGQWIVR